MEKKIADFKECWNRNYSYIVMDLSDDEIMDFIRVNTTIVKAVDMAADHVLNDGFDELLDT